MSISARASTNYCCPAASIWRSVISLLIILQLINEQILFPFCRTHRSESSGVCNLLTWNPITRKVSHDTAGKLCFWGIGTSSWVYTLQCIWKEVAVLRSCSDLLLFCSLITREGDPIYIWSMHISRYHVIYVGIHLLNIYIGSDHQVHLTQDHILEVASFISPRVPRPSVSRLEAGGAEIPLTSFLPSAHTVESTIVLGNGKISARELPFDFSSWNCPSLIWHWWTLYWIHSQKKKKLIDHTTMVEIRAVESESL